MGAASPTSKAPSAHLEIGYGRGGVAPPISRRPREHPYALRVCSPNATLCDGPCTEAYITDAAITCVSNDGIHWSVGVDYPMDVCAGCTPRRPCATCMPAWGQLQGNDCVPFDDTPACMVDDTNGPTVFYPPQFNLGCVPPQGPSP